MAEGGMVQHGGWVIFLVPWGIYFFHTILAFQDNPPGFIAGFFFNIVFCSLLAFVLLMVNSPLDGFFSGVPAENAGLFVLQCAISISPCVFWYLAKKNIGALYAIPSVILVYVILMPVVDLMLYEMSTR